MRELLQICRRAWVEKALQKNILAQNLHECETLFQRYGEIKKTKIDSDNLPWPHKAHQFNALDIALDTGNLKIIQMAAQFYSGELNQRVCFLENDNSDTHYLALEKALMLNSLEAAKILLDAGASPHARSPHGSETILFRLMTGDYPLEEEGGSLDTLKLLLRYAKHDSRHSIYAVSPLLHNTIVGNTHENHYLQSLGFTFTLRDHEEVLNYFAHLYHITDYATGDPLILETTGLCDYLKQIREQQQLQKFQYDLEHSYAWDFFSEDNKTQYQKALATARIRCEQSFLNEATHLLPEQVRTASSFKI